MGPLAKLRGNRHNRFRPPSRALIDPNGRAGGVYTPTYPHPYFGRKFLFLLMLREQCRRKIFKTKELTCKIVQDKELGGISASLSGILTVNRGRTMPEKLLMNKAG
jgi:hypothetical protein